MKCLRLTLTLLSICALSQVANAQATRTWVSGVGDDANPCSRTAPCKTFAGAISKTAPAGVINVLDPGGFGAVTITKSITLEADGELGGVLAAAGNAINVNAGATDVVVLRGLSIEGLGTATHGVIWNSGATLIIDKCTINNFAQKGVFAQPTSSTGGYVSNLFITDSQIRNNDNSPNGGGVLAAARGSVTLKVTLSRVQLINNYYGVRAEDNSYVNAKDSVSAQSVTDGYLAHGSVANAVIYVENSFANNNGGIGIHASGPSFIFLSNTMVTGNQTGLSSDTGGAIYSWGNNRIGGNFIADGSPNSVLSQQ